MHTKALVSALFLRRLFPKDVCSQILGRVWPFIFAQCTEERQMRDRFLRMRNPSYCVSGYKTILTGVLPGWSIRRRCIRCATRFISQFVWAETKFAQIRYVRNCSCFKRRRDGNYAEQESLNLIPGWVRPVKRIPQTIPVYYAAR